MSYRQTARRKTIGAPGFENNPSLYSQRRRREGEGKIESGLAVLEHLILRRTFFRRELAVFVAVAVNPSW